jgi:4,5-dihydroxyphthalate decarboxylase
VTRLALTYGGLSYLDRTVPIETGAVSVPGIDLNMVTFSSPGDLFRRQAQNAEFDVAEMSLSTYLAIVSRGDDRFVGLPIFISRNFRHSQVYVNTEAGIDEPSDLAGRDVGIFEYQMTAGLWIRAFLHQDYGVKATDVTWWEGGLTTPHFAERMALDLQDCIDVRRIPADQTLESMLESGELSALVTVQPPQSFRSPGSRIRRLFPDPRAVELDYYARTGLFPIMHLVVMRREIYQRHRWAAMSLYQGFLEAKQAGMRRLRAITGLAVGLPWLGTALDEIDEVFEGDAFPYGVPANRHALEAAARFSHEQGLSTRVVEVEELFAPEVLVDPMSI